MSFLKKLFKFLLKIFALIVIAVIIATSMGIALPAFLTSLPFVSSLISWVGAAIGAGSWGQLALALFGALAIASPETVGEIVDVVGDVALDVVDSIGSVVGDAIGTIVESTGLGKLLTYGGIGFLLFFLLGRKKDGTISVASSGNAM